MFIFDLEYETATTSLERLIVLSLSSSEEVFPPTHLDPYGFKMAIGVIYSLTDLQGISFQHPMKCKERNMIWEDGSLHWKGTKVEHDRRHPHRNEWRRMESRKLGSYLKIYDTRQ